MIAKINNKLLWLYLALKSEKGNQVMDGMGYLIICLCLAGIVYTAMSTGVDSVVDTVITRFTDAMEGWGETTP
ncbi:MAG: hypothetical protein HPY50_02335 [Firmicutes bacterium]|nr:hypothetical protein [Bacillota bacterium]